jgi:hypothetical protein
MLNPNAMVLVPVSLDSSGLGSVRTPALPPNTAGITVYLQALVGEFTNAMVVRVSL